MMHSSTRQSTTAAGRVAVLLACGLLLLGAACSSDNRTTATSNSSSLCDAKNEVHTSIEALRNVDVVAGGTDALKSVLSGVGTALHHLSSAAQSQYGQDVSEVRDSFVRLRASVSTLGTS